MWICFHVCGCYLHHGRTQPRKWELCLSTLSESGCLRNCCIRDLEHHPLQFVKTNEFFLLWKQTFCFIGLNTFYRIYWLLRKLGRSSIPSLQISPASCKLEEQESFCVQWPQNEVRPAPRLWHEGDAAAVTSRSDLDRSTLSLLILPPWSAGFVGVYRGLAGKIYQNASYQTAWTSWNRKFYSYNLYS